jgi:hypothetical protein
MKQLIILPNNFSLDLLEKNMELFDENIHLIKEINENTEIFNFEKFKNDVKNNIKMVECENDQYYMDSIMNELLECDHRLYEILNSQEKDNLWGECKLAYEIGNIRYEIIYIDPKLLENKISENHLGALLTYEQVGIFGPCVIIASETYLENDEFKHRMVDVSIENIFKILVSKIIVRGIMIKENEVSNVFVSLKKNILNNIDTKYFNDCIDKKVNGFNYYCYQNTIQKDYINVIATKLLNTTIYNDMIIFFEKHNIFLDFNDDIFKKSLINTNINFLPDEKVMDYILFLKEFNKSNNNCICDKKIEKVLICKKCYRQVYCSKGCQIKDWGNHQKNC